MDIDLHKRQLFVRKGKGNKQRYVPIADKALEDIKAYLQEGRYWFLEYQLPGKALARKSDSSAFFLNMKGGRMFSF